MDAPPPLLELVGLTKRYPRGDADEPPVLDALDLRIAAGESLAVLGPSGSGKSTLLHLVAGLDRPTAGRVLFEGRDLAELGEAALARFRRREVGFVFQAHHLLPQCTALENVLVPTLAERWASPPDAAARAWSLLERLGVAHRAGHRPGEMSLGQCQRVAFARALINRPRLVVADEPTGALDARTADELAGRMLDLNRAEGVTLVVATHALPLARRLGRTIELRDGKLVEAAGSGARDTVGTPGAPATPGGPP